MASATRTLTRALRSTPATSALRTPATRRFAAHGRKIPARRGYASEAPRPSGGSNSILLYGGVAAVVLAGAGYYAFGSSTSVAQAAKASSDNKQQGGVFSPSREDYQKVYQAIAKRLIDEDDYDDGSYGPVLLRLGWHSSGKWAAGEKGNTSPFSADRLFPRTGTRCIRTDAALSQGSLDSS